MEADGDLCLLIVPNRGYGSPMKPLRSLTGALLLLGLACTQSSDSKPQGGEGGQQSGGQGGGAGDSVATGGKNNTGGTSTGGKPVASDAGVGGAGGNGGTVGTTAGGTGGTTATVDPYVYVSGYDATITVLRLNLGTGALSSVTTVPSTVASPTYMAVSPDKKYLYAVNEQGGANSKVVAFTINGTNGGLTKINEAPAGGDGSPHLSVHPGGKLVLVAHYGSGHVATLKVDNTGGVVSPPADIERPANDKSHHITADRSGQYVFVCNVSANTVFQYKVDAAGLLTANGQAEGFPGAAGPRHMAFHPTLNVAYTINETAKTVSSLTFDPGTGKLSNPKTQSGLPPNTNFNGGSGAHILVSPDGTLVFASIRGHNSITSYKVNAADGTLTYASNQTAGGMIKTPRDFGIDTTGKYLIVANQDSANVIVLQIATDGTMTVKGQPTTVAKSPAFVGIVALQ
jgi:6-phosphogluconolactonase